MIQEFKQNNKFNYRKHTLYEDKIVVETKTPQHTLKYEIRIDEVGFNIHYEKENTIQSKFFLWILLLAPFIAISVSYFVHNKFDFKIVLLLFGMCYFLAFLVYIKDNKDDLFLIGQKNLLFYREIPNESSVLEFIDLVIATSKKYLKEKYIIIEEDTIEDEFKARLNWLFEIKAITKDEVNDFKEDFKIKKLIL